MSHIALSYSRHSTYEQCPFKFASQFINKTYPDDSDNIHFKKGQRKHSQLENYVKVATDPTMIPLQYDGDVQRATKIVDGLVAHGFELKAELQMAVDKDWNPITWFSKSSMYRAICDLLAIKGYKAKALDWKTGKFRDYDGTPTGQLHITSAVIFAHFPKIEEIESAYVYIEHGQTVRRLFTRDMYDKDLRTPFDNLFIDINQDSEFAPKRNQYCNWCLIKDTICPLFSKSQPEDIPY